MMRHRLRCSYVTVAGEVTDEGASNVVVTDMEAALNDPAIVAMFIDKDGNIAWMEYNDYLIFHM